MWDPFQREILAALGLEPLVQAPPVVPDDPLLHALLRAVGRDRDSADLAQVLRMLQEWAQLRGDVAAKRASWPRLRTLRSHP
ncbi:hypothetical protein [Cognatiluteimonas profundi]|uniref:hypothetical protein n=1 Tax=Cognatiluteimonas profundi TaxID=2594501 RepID=UPI00131B7122|nr:hypothetical protein [Lysobacter profundi]